MTTAEQMDEPTFVADEDNLHDKLLCEFCCGLITVPVTHELCGRMHCKACVLKLNVNTRCGCGQLMTAANNREVRNLYVDEGLNSAKGACSCCKAPMKAGDFKGHVVVCPNVITQCPLACTWRGNRNLLEDHASKCPLVTVNCRASNCTWHDKRALKEEHEANCVVVALEHQLVAKARTIADYKRGMETVSDAVTSLKQRFEALQIETALLQAQNTLLQNKLHEHENNSYDGDMYDSDSRDSGSEDCAVSDLQILTNKDLNYILDRRNIRFNPAMSKTQKIRHLLQAVDGNAY